jgi:hypothetical protein
VNVSKYTAISLSYHIPNDSRMWKRSDNAFLLRCTMCLASDFCFSLGRVSSTFNDCSSWTHSMSSPEKNKVYVNLHWNTKIISSYKKTVTVCNKYWHDFLTAKHTNKSIISKCCSVNTLCLGWFTHHQRLKLY